MRRAAILAGVLTVLLLVPAATAFHGGPYKAKGEARLRDGPTDLDPQTYDAVVTYGGFANEYFTVNITDQDTGEIVVHDEFPGVEALNPGIPLITPCIEGDQLIGMREIIAPYWSHDTAQDVDFNLFGYQKLDGCQNSQEMRYEGNYNDYELSLTVWQECCN